MNSRYPMTGTGFDIAAVPYVAPNKGGRPRDERLAALDERAAAWLAEDDLRAARDAARLLAPEYIAEWYDLQPIEKNDRLNEVRKRINNHLLRLGHSIR